MTRTPNLYGNPRPSPRVLRTSVQEIERTKGPIWSEEDNRRAQLASHDDPQIVAERQALREKFQVAGVVPPSPQNTPGAHTGE